MAATMSDFVRGLSDQAGTAPHGNELDASPFAGSGL